jgi:hypothetical protein
MARQPDSILLKYPRPGSTQNVMYLANWGYTIFGSEHALLLII